MIKTIVISPRKNDREKITTLLSTEVGIKVLAQGKDGYDAIKLVGSLKPDIAILDNNLEFIDGEEIPPLLRVRSPSTAVVIIVAKMSDYQLCRAASNEVSGFVNKATDIDTLPGILKFVSEGSCFISPAFAARILHLLCTMNNKNTAGNGSDTIKIVERTEHAAQKDKLANIQFLSDMDPADYLSKTELRILVEIGEGHTSAEIAVNLGLAIGTVRNYISSVMRKTGLNNRSQMVRYACGCGLVRLNSHNVIRERKIS